MIWLILSPLGKFNGRVISVFGIFTSSSPSALNSSLVFSAAGNTSVTVASKFKTISSSANGRDQRCLAFVGLIICGNCCCCTIIDLWSLLLLIIDSRDNVVPIRLSMAITLPSTKGFLKLPSNSIPSERINACGLNLYGHFIDPKHIQKKTKRPSAGKTEPIRILPLLKKALKHTTNAYENYWIRVLIVNPSRLSTRSEYHEIEIFIPKDVNNKKQTACLLNTIGYTIFRIEQERKKRERHWPRRKKKRVLYSSIDL
uniref:Uncharacterized protein n=1 Tax=Glossina pallidipes TaxID=7398 RepID=A0A1B0A7E7_GLOPL